MKVNNDNQEIIYYQNEEQVSFKYACQAYKNGVRQLYFRPSDNHVPIIKDIRVFIINRSMLIGYNVIRGLITRYLKDNIYSLRPAFLKNILIKYHEHKCGKRIVKLLAGIEHPTTVYTPVKQGKVQLFIGSLGPGGAERQLVNAVTGLAKSRELLVTCQHYEPTVVQHFSGILLKNGISVNQLKSADEARALLDAEGSQNIDNIIKNEFFYKEHYFGESLIPYIYEIIKNRPDVIHAWLDYFNIRAGLAALIVGVPKIILSLRSVAPDNFKLFTLEMKPVYKVLLQSERVIFVNNSLSGASDYCRWLGIRPEKIKVISNGILFPDKVACESDILEFCIKYNIPSEVPVVGTIIRFSEEKRPLLWIKHASELLKLYPTAHFLLVGDGEMFNEAIALARKLKIDHRISCTGILEQPSLALKAMDVFVLSSRYEGLPNVLIEAQSMGVPVVTTDAGGSAETLLEGITGYVVKRPTPQKIAMYVNKILNDKQWRERAGHEGPKYVNDKFNLDKMVQKYNAIYE